MRLLAFAAVLLAGGCAGRNAASVPPAAPPAERTVRHTEPADKLIVTPSAGRVGKVIWVNRPGRFVVLNFLPGQAPPPGQRLSLYRNGAKAGEARITHSRDENNFVADVLSGEAQLGDEARED